MKILSVTIVLSFSFFSASVFSLVDSCKESILTNTCLVDRVFESDRSKSYPENKIMQLSVPCLSGSKSYAIKIYNLYDSLPEHSKEAFCLIKKIFIVPGDVNFGGRANTSFDAKTTIDESMPDAIGYKANGFILELSKKFRFDRDETIVDYANRVMQGYFTINTLNGDTEKTDFPFYKYEGDYLHSELYGTIVHEIGHFLDYSQEVTTLKFDIVNDIGIAKPNEWIDVSWNDVWADFGFNLTPVVSGLLVNRPYTTDRIEDIFIDLNSSPFVSFYSLTRPVEDFAEHYTRKNLQGEFKLYHSNGVPFHPGLNRPMEFHEKDTLMDKYMSAGFREILNQKIRWIYDYSNSQKLDRGYSCRH